MQFTAVTTIFTLQENAFYRSHNHFHGNLNPLHGYNNLFENLDAPSTTKTLCATLREQTPAELISHCKYRGFSYPQITGIKLIIPRDTRDTWILHLTQIYESHKQI